MHQTIDQGVGGEVKRLRSERDWSMAKLAVEADMSVSGVSMIENGKRNLTTTTLAKLARAFGVEVVDLFPKAEAPLWSDETLGQRSSAFSFEEARESLERYCERWEDLLSKEELDDKALDEFFTTAEGWLPILDVALGAEIAEKAASGEQQRTEIGRANRRYLKLLSRIADTLANRLEEGPDEISTVTSNVIRMQEFRDRPPKWAVG